MVRIIVSDDLKKLGEIAAKEILKQIASKPESVIGLATGSSPLPIYDALIAKRETVDWQQVRAFALDEYLGLPASHDQSYGYFVNENFTAPLGLSPKNVRVLNGVAADPEAECSDFEDAIKAAGGVDCQIIGIGRNGHIGFNEPGSPLDSRTRIVPLTEETIADNARFFDSIEEVPTKSVTQGVGTVFESRQLLLIANGAAKAEAIASALDGEKQRSAASRQGSQSRSVCSRGLRRTGVPAGTCRPKMRSVLCATPGA